jgi:tetratricopeptide (TPR) repeat protein
VNASSKLWPGLICLLLVASVLGLYAGALNCEFVNYDDPAYVTSNAQVEKGLTWPGVLWALQSGAASNWHPLTWMSHMIDVTVWGLNPRGHHLTNIILHAANAALLFLLLRELTGAMGRSAAVAALFALHPLRVESVAWVSERKDVLSALFWILTVWAYARYARQRQRKYYVLSIAAFVLGLMAKPMLVTLPFVLLLLDYWPLGRVKQDWKQLCLEKIPYLVPALASSVVTFIVQQRGGAVSAMAALSVGARVANVFISYVRYLGKTFWPLDLSILYPHPRHWPAWEVIASVLFLTAVTAAIWRWRRQQPWLVTGWLWFLGMLMPVIGLVQVGIQSMADRYTYLPGIGILIMVVWSLDKWLGATPAGRWSLLSAGAAAALACAALTVRQVGYWANSEALFEHAVAVTEDNYLAYNNIGFYLTNRGQGAKAMEFYRRSLEINPNYEDAHNNLGFALAGACSNQAAIAEYIKALSINSNLTEAHNNLGNALAAVGSNAEAMHEYEVALQEDPHHAQAHNNLGIALATHGRLDEAIGHFREAIVDKPDYASAHSDLGNALALQGKWDEAIEQYEICLKLDPNDPQLHNNLGNVLAQQGRLDEALSQYAASVKGDASNAGTRVNFAQALLRKGRRDEAIAQLREAARLKPGDPAIQQQLNAVEAR